MPLTPQFNIDNLAKLAHDRNDESNWQSLWGAVFGLPAWYAVGDTQRPDAPMVLVMRDQPTIVVFTDEHKARVFINKGPAKGASTVIPMRLPGALGFLSHLASRGVTQILFNLSPTAPGFGYSLPNLSRLGAVFNVIDPTPPRAPTPQTPSGDDQLDALVGAMAAQPSEAASAALFSHVYSLPAWHFVARGEAPNLSPHLGMLNQAPVIMAFTNEPLARAYATSRTLTTNAGEIAILSVPPAAAIGTVESTMGAAGIVFNDGSHGFFAPTRTLRPMLEQFNPPAAPANPPTT